MATTSLKNQNFKISSIFAKSCFAKRKHSLFSFILFGKGQATCVIGQNQKLLEKGVLKQYTKKKLKRNNKQYNKACFVTELHSKYRDKTDNGSVQCSFTVSRVFSLLLIGLEPKVLKRVEPFEK